MTTSLTDLQLAIMRILWDRAEATVLEVQTHLRPERDLAQTTIATRLSFGNFDGTNCNLTQTVDTVTSATDPQITRDVTPGNYCVRIADIGQVTQIATFSVSIVITPS